MNQMLNMPFGVFRDKTLEERDFNIETTQTTGSYAISTWDDFSSSAMDERPEESTAGVQSPGIST